MSNPWDNVSVWKDEKAYLNWLRSQTRRIWSRHPVKIAYKQARRYKAPVGKNGKEVWVSDCELCGKQSRKCEVDHLIMGGCFRDWQSYTEWAKRILWVSFDDIRELCPDCHSTITHQQKTGLSFEEAKKDKELIAKMKQPVKDQKKELLEAGYSESEISNREKRRECYKEMLK